jgi:hypothetical protein
VGGGVSHLKVSLLNFSLLSLPSLLVFSGFITKRKEEGYK